MIPEIFRNNFLLVSKMLPYYTGSSDNSAPHAGPFHNTFFLSFQINYDNDKHRVR